MLFEWLSPGSVITAAVVLLFYVIVTSCYRRAGAPPGPPLFPLIGNLWLFYRAKIAGQRPFQLFMKLSKQYGPVFSMRLGAQNLVVLNDYAHVKESIIKDADSYASRPMTTAVAVANGVPTGCPVPGIINNSKAGAQQLRRLSLTTLRDLGVGKLSLEERVREEAIEVVKEISKNVGEPFHDMKRVLGMATCNIICSILFGQRYKYEDKAYQDIVGKLQLLFANDGPTYSSINHFPFMKWFVGKKIKTARESLESCFEWMETEIDRHRADLDQSTIRDFVDLFLQKENTGELPHAGANLRGVMKELFVAGTDTSASALAWCVFACVQWPHYQERCRKDVERVFGIDSSPSYKQKLDTPFVHAFINEVLRFYSVATSSLPRTVEKATRISGFTIYPGDVLILNIYAINHDVKYWGDPEVFRPERWLDENGSFQSKESFLPFGSGRRVCLGEQLARAEIFVIFCTMLQKVRVQLHDDFPLPEGYDNKAILQPKPFTVVVNNI